MKRSKQTNPRNLWLAGLAIAVPAAAVVAVALVGGHSGADHPEPRPDVTGEHVLHSGSVPRTYPNAVESYQIARQIPAVLDGMRCFCACKATLGHRSLLSCFEDDHGAQCEVCQDEALIAADVGRRGGTLEDARRAVDARFGPG